jgi:hypothetical protein
MATSEHAKGKHGPGSMDKNAMWIEKYRPKSLDEVAAHKEIIDTSEIPLSADLRT